MPMQYTDIFFRRKKKLTREQLIFFLIFAQNIDCGQFTQYRQSMFWSKNKKNRYTPANPSFTIKVGFKGVYIARSCYHHVKNLYLMTTGAFVETVPTHVTPANESLELTM